MAYLSFVQVIVNETDVAGVRTFILQAGALDKHLGDAEQSKLETWAIGCHSYLYRPIYQWSIGADLTITVSDLKTALTQANHHLEL